jgi:hypothetical protein
MVKTRSKVVAAVAAMVVMVEKEVAEVTVELRNVTSGSAKILRESAARMVEMAVMVVTVDKVEEDKVTYGMVPLGIILQMVDRVVIVAMVETKMEEKVVMEEQVEVVEVGVMEVKEVLVKQETKVRMVEMMRKDAVTMAINKVRVAMVAMAAVLEHRDSHSPQMVMSPKIALG